MKGLNSKFIVEIEYDRYLVEYRSGIVENITSVQQRFDEWLYDKNNDHGLWVSMTDNPDDVNDSQSPYYGSVLDPNGRDGVCYGINDFLGWLNQNYGCDAKVIAEEKAGLHHVDEYNEWLRERGLEQNLVQFVRTIDGYNHLNNSALNDWGEVLKDSRQEAPAEEYNDPLRYFKEFEKASGLTPEILRMHREENVPLLYF